MDINKFTVKTQESFKQAKNLAISNNNSEISIYHLLQLFLQETEGGMYNLFNHFSANKTVLAQKIKDKLNQLPKIGNVGNVTLNDDLEGIIVKAEEVKNEMKDKYLSGEHLIVAGIQQNQDLKAMFLGLNIDEQKIMEAIKEERQGKSISNDNPDATMNVLNKYCIDLTKKAADGKIDPVVGRDQELQRMIQILGRRLKNNPVIIGEPGVGKTAVVEGLALKLVTNDVPDILLHKRLLALDITALVAGAKFKGEFEERLKSLLDEITASANTIILFIDEIHNIMQANSGGGMDAANLLKPALSRGEFSFIGATTLTEFKILEKDPALTRRLETVLVEEPSLEKAVIMLQGIKHKFEKYHQITIPNQAIMAAVKLSSRYITDRNLPDKAIDLIDEACSVYKLKENKSLNDLNDHKEKIVHLEMQLSSTENPELNAEIKKQITDLESKKDQLQLVNDEQKNFTHKIQTLNDKLAELKKQEKELEISGQMNEASKLKYADIPNTEKEIQDLISKNKNSTNSHEDATNTPVEILPTNTIGVDDITKIIAMWTKIPLDKLKKSEKEKLLHMEEELGKRLIGQKHPINSISNTVRRSRLGLADEGKPIGSFLFLGPTGVGKTELAKTLAVYLFNQESSLIRFDMSEYMEKHANNKLIGAPPGYVGYEEGGKLTESVRKNPFSILLFDEVEKAHPDVFNLFLQILDDGRLTDNHGRLIDFKNTIIILTSNIGSKDILELQEKQSIFEMNDLGKEVVNPELMATIQTQLFKFFRPEMLNRLDETIVFHPLTLENVYQILGIQLARINHRLIEQGMRLTLDQSATDYLANKGFNPSMGARPLKRVLQSELLDNLAVAMLSNNLSGDIVVKFAEQKIQFCNQNTVIPATNNNNENQGNQGNILMNNIINQNNQPIDNSNPNRLYTSPINNNNLAISTPPTFDPQNPPPIPSILNNALAIVSPTN